MKHRNVTLFLSAVAMAILILDSENAVKASFQGVQLCIQTLIPTLFPYFVLSSLLTSSLIGIRNAMLQPLEALLRIPKGTGCLFLIGLLGGYPVGARCIRHAYDEKQLSKKDADRMLCFCSNAGPSFLFGIVAAFFPHWRYPCILWGIHILSAIFVALVTSGSPDSQPSLTVGDPIKLTQAMEQALRSMATVCGWVILFRLILSFPARWLFWMLPTELGVLVTGLLELSNGCILLGKIASVPRRMMVAAIILSFGGLCVTMQTKSLLGPLSFPSYLRGKLLQSGFAGLLCADYLYISAGLFGPALIVPNLLVFTWIMRKNFGKKNLVAFPA